jgi:hypothetical protein
MGHICACFSRMHTLNEKSGTTTFPCLGCLIHDRDIGASLHQCLGNLYVLQLPLQVLVPIACHPMKSSTSHVVGQVEGAAEVDELRSEQHVPSPTRSSQHRHDKVRRHGLQVFPRYLFRVPV